MSLLIGYLVDSNRTYMFEKICNFFNNIKNKDKITLPILATSDCEQFYNKNKNKLVINNFVCVVNRSNNYILKIKFLINYAKKNGYKYCMKLDNDLLLPSFVFDRLFENLNILDNDDNLFLSPTLSSGIPTVEYFNEDFFDKEDKEELEKSYLMCNFPKNLWDYDYSFLNNHTINTDVWDSKEYNNSLLKCGYNYTGIHPVRITSSIIDLTNQKLLKYKEKFYKEEKDVSLFYTKEPVYFCNSVFCIRTDVYDKIVSDQSLYVDQFDEVPLNKYCKKHNLNMVFIRKCYGIHIIYNSIPNHIEKEKQFVNNFLI